ncbi:MAG: hypothetical protein C4534_07615 [Gaiellales bacterium]|nr:MAG: hypothetical protein C4534_07615 [Gaiellales bacterium]
MRAYTKILLLTTIAFTAVMSIVSLGTAQSLPDGFEPEGEVLQRVSSLEEQADAIRADIANLNRELEILVEDYNATRVRLDELTLELADNHIRLDALWERYRVEEQQLSDRLVSIYKAGKVNVIEIMANSDDFNDFYVQLSYMKKVNDQDYKLQMQYKASAKEVGKLAEEIDASRSEQLDLEKQLSGQKEAVESLVAEREALLGQVNAEVQQILQQEAERQLQEQLRARAEAEALLAELQISDETQAQVVLTALQYLGVPYVWGGESPDGFDCSGLTKYVYAQHGVSLPHYAASQYNMGVPVPNEMLQPGDLIFWGPGHPHHVGIYIGQGKYIEASGFGEMVKISTLSFDGDYAGARRFPLKARGS